MRNRRHKAPSQLGAEGRKATISQCGICSFLPKQAIVSIVIFGFLFYFVAGCCLVAVAAASWQPNPWPSCIRIDIHLRVSFIACSVSLSRFHSEGMRCFPDKILATVGRMFLNGHLLHPKMGQQKEGSICFECLEIFEKMT